MSGRRRAPVSPWVAVAVLAVACGGPEPPAAPVVPVDPRTDDPRVVAQFDEATRLLAAGRAGEAARIYHAYGMLDAAASAYRRAVREEPDRFEWRYLLADVERRRGHGEAALEQLARALELRPEHVPARLAAGELRLDRHELAAARADFESVLVRSPGSAAALAGLGRVALAADDPAAAAELLERALEIDPGATALRYPLGLAHRALGNRERAVELLATRGGRAPRVADPLLEAVGELAAGVVERQNEGMDLLRRGRTAEAVEVFRAAARERPEDARVVGNLGHALMLDGRPAEALAAFDEALRLDPAYVTARFNRGVALAALGRDEEAVDAYRDALRADPSLVAARFNLGNALRRLGRHERAVEELAAAVRLRPDHAEARLAEALTLVRLGREAEAAARLAEATTVLPDDEALLHARTRLLAAARDPAVRDGALAARLAERLGETPRSLDHALTLAMVAAENGEYEAAGRIQRRALEAAGDAPAPLLAEMRRNLARYRDGRPCPRPWPPGEP